jgi:DNA primase
LRKPTECDLLYRLPELVAALDARVPEVFLVEGEHDVETLRALGHVASTNWAGAGQWIPEHAQWFRHYTGLVNVVVDNDAPGAAEGVLKFDSLDSAGVRALLLRPPEGLKDVSDLLDAGGDVGDLEEVEREELALLGHAWLTPSRKREWMGYGVELSFLARVLSEAQ